jgi:hypothetical protein
MGNSCGGGGEVAKEDLQKNDRITRDLNDQNRNRVLDLASDFITTY